MNDRIMYWNKEVADLLKVGDSTLRKWCILLEERGYIFLKDEQNRRGFRDKDVVLLRRFRDLTKQAGMTLENAANVVLSTEEAPQRMEVVPSEKEKVVPDLKLVEGYFERHVQFSRALVEQQQEKFERTLAEQLDKQQGKLEMVLEERLDEQKAYYESLIERSVKTRDEQLMAVIREMQEERRQLAVAQEERQKKGFFARLFGK